MATWIDFKELRLKLKFSEVLKHYNVQLKIKGHRATGPCPLPTHQGNRQSSSFSADVERGIWRCFGCHAKGNVLDFACRMEGFDPHNSRELREGAIKVQEDFFGTGGGPMPVSEPQQKTKPLASAKVLINQPIDFELKTLDPDHPYLKERGFSDETIRYFGLGYCNRGMLKGRIAIPLHDPEARLLGYAGRLTKDSEISAANPKYKLPGTRERSGVVHEFRKSCLLYNRHRVIQPTRELIVVEGFPSVWWLHQCGFQHVIGLMGAACSVEQAHQILAMVHLQGRIWIMTDADQAGDQCRRSCLDQLAPFQFVRCVKLGDGEQPTDHDRDKLREMLA